MEISKINWKKWTIGASIVLLAITLIIRLLDFAKITKYFPTDNINDISSYMAQLFFLDACGFHQMCQYWYNGFTAFLFTPPGWYWFAYPWYVMSGDVKIATFIAVIITLIIAFVFIYKFGKHLNIKPWLRVLFFLIVFANANAIRGFLRTGRPHEMLAWVWFIMLFWILIYYKDKKIDAKIYWTSLVFAAIILTYVAVAIFAAMLFLGFVLCKKGSERFKAMSAAVIGFLLTTFWSIPYVINLGDSVVTSLEQGRWLLMFQKELLLKQAGAFIFPLIFLILFYIMWKERKEKTTLYFFAPLIVLAIAFATRITAFIPALKDIFPSPYFSLFIILGAYCLMQIVNEPKGNKTFLYLGVFAAIVISCSIALFYTVYFEVPNEEVQDLLELIPKIEERYALFGLPPSIYPKAIVAYAAIYHQKSTYNGHYIHVKNKEYKQEIELLSQAHVKRDCKQFTEKMEILETTEVIGKESCSFFEQCGFSLKAENGGFCLYSQKAA
ncbi:MAG: hypothetical protein Q8L34_04170 [Candidatus Woesearchaeota archaeon]|nr:hypothetical protein [Candidatus Woesearchaeota archaeon]